MSRTTILTTLLSLAALASRAWADLPDVFVPGDYPTIQAAADGVAPNTEIVIKSGTYNEAVTFTGKSNLNILCKGKVVITPPTSNGIGLTLDTCDGFYIQGLRVQGGGVGIHLLNSDNITFFLGGVADTIGDGILIEGGGPNTFEKLTIKNVGGDGVDMAVGNLNTTDSNSFFVCKFIHPGVDGVGINGSNNHVDGCTITAAQRDGVSITPTSGGNGNTVKDTKIVKVARHAILTKADNTKVDGCKITAPGGLGFDFESGTGGHVNNSKFRKTGQHGAELSGDGITLDTDLFSTPGLDGVSVSGDGVVVESCKVTGAVGSGFDIAGTNGTYTGDASAKAKQDGFFLGGTGNTLSTCTAKGSKGFDLDNPVPANNPLGEGNSFKTQGPP